MPISILIVVFVSCSTIFGLTTRDLGEKRTLNTCLPPRPRIPSRGLFDIGAIRSTSIPIHAGEQNFSLAVLAISLAGRLAVGLAGRLAVGLARRLAILAGRLAVLTRATG